MDFSLESAKVVLTEPKSIIISSKFGEIFEFCDFWNLDFGWTPTVVDLVGVHPKTLYCVLYYYTVYFIIYKIIEANIEVR
jgi:hypothetical protein